MNSKRKHNNEKLSREFYNEENNFSFSARGKESTEELVKGSINSKHKHNS